MLDTNENLKKALVNRNVLYLEINGNLQEVNKIRFVFLGETEYYLETAEIKRSYEFTADNLGIKDLGNLEKASAILEKWSTML